MFRLKNILKFVTLMLSSLLTATFSMEKEEQIVIQKKEKWPIGIIGQEKMTLSFDNKKAVNTFEKILYLCVKNDYEEMEQEIQSLSEEELFKKYKEVLKKLCGGSSYVCAKHGLSSLKIISPYYYQDLIELQIEETDVFNFERLSCLDTNDSKLKILNIGKPDLKKNTNILHTSLIKFIAKGYFKNLSVFYLEKFNFKKENEISLNNSHISRSNTKSVNVRCYTLYLGNKCNNYILYKTKNGDIHYSASPEITLTLKNNSREYNKIQNNLYQNSLR